MDAKDWQYKEGGGLDSLKSVSTQPVAADLQAALPLAVPPLMTSAFKQQTAPSEAVSGLNLQLPSALTSILTARKQDPTASVSSGFVAKVRITPGLYPNPCSQRTSYF